jgi:hypothetical protein
MFVELHTQFIELHKHFDTRLLDLLLFTRFLVVFVDNIFCQVCITNEFLEDFTHFYDLFDCLF